jgi:ArsR family transcriptional regulator
MTFTMSTPARSSTDAVSRRHGHSDDSAAADAELAGFAKAAGHPVRVQILRMLAQREARHCCDIVGALPLAQSTVSEHLRILKNAGLVCAREDGPRVTYCIAPAALARLKRLVADL